MSARNMILGSLMESPVHGYDLKKRVFRKVFSDFGINDGQLYPLLNKLEAEGLIRKQVIVQEGAPSRHKYFITDAGRAAFASWLESPEGEERSMRYDFMRKDEFFTRCNYIRHLDKKRAVAKMERQIQLVRDTLADFHAARDSMMDKNVDPYRIRLLEYGIKNQEARLAWLQDFLSDIRKDRGFNKKWNQTRPAPRANK
jgi:DNA-binding PadR family transcriptional regulator